MDRVECLIVHRRRIPLVRPFVTAVRTATFIDAVLVEVRDSDGRSGWGEAPTSWRVTGESPESVTAAVEGPLSAAIAGHPIDDAVGGSKLISRSVVRNPAARMAVECALYDLAAQLDGVPLYRFLGGSRPTVRTDMTLSAGSTVEDTASLVSTALGYRDAGFNTLKVKVGSGGDDVRTLRELRKSLGNDVVLRVDANQGWNAKQAVGIIHAWEDSDLKIELVEQPVNMDDLDGLEYVTRNVGTPILADESVWTTRELKEVLRRRAATMVNIKLAKCGGLRIALDLLELAQKDDVAAIVGCMMESNVGISAAASFGSVIDSGMADASAVHDLDAGLWLTSSPTRGGADYEVEAVRLSDAPGLGFSGLEAEV